MKIIATINEVNVFDWCVNAGEYKAKKCIVETPKEFAECNAIMVSFNSKENGKFVSWVKESKCDIPCFTNPGTVSVGVYAYIETEGNLELRFSPSPVVLPINEGSYLEGEEPPTPTPGLCEEFVEELKRVGSYVTEDDLSRSEDEMQSPFNVYISPNLLNPETVTLNKRMDASGNELDGVSYGLTDYIPVNSGDAIVFQAIPANGTTTALKAIRFVTAYDENKNILSSKGTNTSATSYTTPDGVSFVRLSLPDYTNYVSRMVHVGTDILPYEPYGRTRTLKEECHDMSYIKEQTKKQFEEGWEENSQQVFNNHISPNLLNTETVTLNKGLDASGGEYERDTWGLTDYIPVNSGDVIVFQSKNNASGVVAFRQIRFVTAYDENKTIIPSVGSNNATLTSYVVPDGVCFIRLTVVDYTHHTEKMIHKSSDILPYEPYGTTKILKEECHNIPYIREQLKEATKGRKLALPPKLYGFVGYPINIYFRNIMDYHPNDVYVRKYGSSSKGKQYDDHWEYTPTSAENVVGSIMVYNHDYEQLNDQNIPVEIKDTTLKSSLKVLVLGDSTVNAGKETAKMVELATSDNYDLTLIGTCGSGSNKYEGRGGWTAKMYVDTQQSGSITNPFYNPSSSTFDFAYYMNQQGYSDLDCVFIQLGINDVFSAQFNNLESAINTYITNMQTIVNSIHSYDSNIKIVINLIIPCGTDQNAFTSYYNLSQRTWQCKKNTYEANITLLDTFKNMTNVFLSPYNAAIDSVNNLPSDVHPNLDGYNQLGTQMYSYMRAIN